MKYYGVRPHCKNTMGSDPIVKKFFSHYAPRPLQQPQMPDMKQVKRSVCNHIRHFSLLSYLPSAGNPDTQPPIRRLALPIIRSITQPNARAFASTQSPSFHRPRHPIHPHSSPPPAGNSFVPTALTPHPTNTALFSKWCWCESPGYPRRKLSHLLPYL